MPDFPAPAANQLQIPDYSKTLNALAMMQQAQAHSELYRLQAQMQDRVLGGTDYIRNHPEVMDNPNALAGILPPQHFKEIIEAASAANKFRGEKKFTDTGGADSSLLTPEGRQVVANTVRTHGESALQQFDIYGRVGNSLRNAASTQNDEVWHQAVANSGLSENDQRVLNSLPKEQRTPRANQMIAAGMHAKEYMQPIQQAPGHGQGPASQATGLEGTVLPNTPRQPTTQGSNLTIPQAVQQAAERHGIDPRALQILKNQESGGGLKGGLGDDNGGGIFQLNKDNLKERGVTNPLDHTANAEAAAQIWNDNKARLTKALGREPTNGELALAHNQGAAGAIALITHPNENAADVLTPVYGNRISAVQAVGSKNGGRQGMTAAEFAQTKTAPYANIDNAPRQAQAPTRTEAPITPNPVATQRITPSPTPGGTPVFGPTPPMSPEAFHEQGGRGSELGKLPAKLSADADAARLSKTTVANLREASKDIPMGWGSDWAVKAATIMKPFAQAMGVNTFDNPAVSAAKFDKYSQDLVSKATTDVSKRAAVQEMQMISRSVPTRETPREAFNDLVDGFDAIHDFRISKASSSSKYEAQHGGTLKGFENEWNDNITPSAFRLHNLAARSPKDAAAVIAKMKATEEGKQMLKSIAKQIQWGEKYGAFDNLPKG